MPLLNEVEALFPCDLAPYELVEVVDRLRAHFGSSVTSHTVYRALEWLRAQSATASLVAPLNPRSTPRLYSCEGARRIARRAARRARRPKPSASRAEMSAFPGSMNPGNGDISGATRDGAGV